MDPRDEVVRVEEEKLTKEREKTRHMQESLRADRAATEAMERKLWMLLREKDRLLGVTGIGEMLVAEFLDADDGNRNLDEKAMMDAIVALLGAGGGDGKDCGGFGGV